MTKHLILFLATTALFTMAHAGIQFEFSDVEDYKDFSLSGMSEAKTLPVLERELERRILAHADRFVAESHTLTVTVTDIDMAGEIQPWRNQLSQDIRYIESIYPPRITLSYTLTNADGETIASGEDVKLSDLSFQVDTQRSASQRSFHYEINLIEDWLRKEIAPLSADRVEG